MLLVETSHLLIVWVRCLRGRASKLKPWDIENEWRMYATLESAEIFATIEVFVRGASQVFRFTTTLGQPTSQLTLLDDLKPKDLISPKSPEILLVCIGRNLQYAIIIRRLQHIV